MSSTNTLTSHHGESRTSRADKMSGWISYIKKITSKLNLDRVNSYAYAKKFTNKKRRMFLKNKKNWKKNMKSYPKIDYFDKGFFGDTVWAFDKIDGSNLRMEWNRRRGWYKFGTRNVMINESDPNFGESIPIFMEKYADDLTKVFKKEYSNTESVVVFCEFIGENSFAGKHLPEDKKDVVLFDVNLYKKGFITPKDFIDNFGHLHIPNLIYKGEYDQNLIRDIRKNIWGLKEGVICKGVRKTKGDELVWMTKIKSIEWLDKVRELYGEKALLEELNNNKNLLSYGN